MKKITVSFFLLMCSVGLHAESIYTPTYHEILNVVSYSKDDLINPEWAGSTAITFANDLDWSLSTTCNKRTVVVRGGDSHTLATVLTAKASNQKVRIYIDDTQRVGDDVQQVRTDYCYVRALRY